MRPKLTVLIPCKNERKHIADCVAAIRQLADEILVADCYSTDGTLDILAQIGGCRLIQREFIDFASFKNWAIALATHPWILLVDADERVTSELAVEIHQLLLKLPDNVDAYTVPRRLFFLGHPIRFSGCQNDRPIRLIHRDRCRYEPRRVHEKIAHDPRRVGHLKNQLLHYSFQTYGEYLVKNLKYTEWAAEELWEKGHRAGFVDLLIRPVLRFLQLYVVRLGFLDGLSGLQMCLLTSFFLSFLKQGRLWEWEHAVALPQQSSLHLPGPHLDLSSGVVLPRTGPGEILAATEVWNAPPPLNGKANEASG